MSSFPCRRVIACTTVLPMVNPNQNKNIHLVEQSLSMVFESCCALPISLMILNLFKAFFNYSIFSLVQVRVNFNSVQVKNEIYVYFNLYRWITLARQDHPNIFALSLHPCCYLHVYFTGCDLCLNNRCHVIDL